MDYALEGTIFQMALTLAWILKSTPGTCTVCMGDAPWSSSKFSVKIGGRNDSSQILNVGNTALNSGVLGLLEEHELFPSDISEY